MILYDSQYAYGVTRLFNPDTNLGLATTVASLVDAVRSKMKLDFTHVRSLRGIHGNEIADRLAKRGANNHLTPLHGLDSPPTPPLLLRGSVESRQFRKGRRDTEDSVLNSVLGLTLCGTVWKVRRFRLQSSGPGRQVFWNTMCSGGT